MATMEASMVPRKRGMRRPGAAGSVIISCTGSLRLAFMDAPLAAVMRRG